MMLSMAVQLQPNLNICLNTSNFPAQTATSKPSQVPFAVKQRTAASSSIANLHSVSRLKLRGQNFRNLQVYASAATAEAVESASESPVADDSDSESSSDKEVSLSLSPSFSLSCYLVSSNECLFCLLDRGFLKFGGEQGKVW